MTKTELKVILKLIDLRTSVSDIMSENGKIIFEKDIHGLKEDITELYGGGNDTEDAKKV